MGFKACVHVIGGYRQSEFASTGVSQLADKIMHMVERNTEVRVLPWNANWKQYVQMITRSCRDECVHIVVGYSFGAGYGAKSLCKQLNYEGKRIALLLLIDPVIRIFSVLPMNVLSLTRLGEFECPANVDVCYSFRQVNDRPPGRRVYRWNEHGAREYVPEIVLGAVKAMHRFADRSEPHRHPLRRAGDRAWDYGIGHSSIDNSPIVHQCCLSAIEAALHRAGLLPILPGGGGGGGELGGFTRSPGQKGTSGSGGR